MRKSKPKFVTEIDNGLGHVFINHIEEISNDVVDFLGDLESVNVNRRISVPRKSFKRKISLKSIKNKKNLSIIKIGVSEKGSNFLNFSSVNKVAIKTYGNKKSLENLPKGVRVVSFKG